MFQLTLWSIPPVAAAMLSLYAFWRASPRSHVPGGHALRFLFIALFLWAAPQAVETMLTDARAKLLFSQLSYLGIALTPVAWFQFALTYSRRVLRMSARILNVITIVPLLTVVLVISNDWHHLFWSGWSIVETGGYVGLLVERGLWFYIHAFYSYGLMLAATAILAFSLTQFQLNMQALLAAVSAPLIGVMANLYSLSSFNPSPWMDFTTLGFFLAILILDRGILREGLLNRIPVMRDRVVEQLTDPVLVIAHSGAIIDANQSALSAWRAGGESILDQPIETVIEHLPLERVRDPGENSEVSIGNEIYEVAATPLDSSNGRSDIALVFRDVTERRLSERKLREVTDELERMAHTDALTNMFNRRYFMQRLSEEFDRVSRHGSTLSVLIYDLDHFKNVNDSHGHDVGDKVLVAVSTVTNQVKRTTDVACRLGGEEFALLLPETNKQGAIKLAQRLRAGIEQFPYSELVSKNIQVTASIGVATVSPKIKEPLTILKVADRALYKAKNGGRNMVCYDNE
ncbi:MAG: diguanylate cyclase [Pseudomonadales bacterium]|nr:diguanylate cyclase [Pseudomonadales bacterium]